MFPIEFEVTFAKIAAKLSRAGTTAVFQSGGEYKRPKSVSRMHMPARVSNDI
jgi:hypothetical protein